MCGFFKPYLTFDRDGINRIIPSKTEMPPIKEQDFALPSKPLTDFKAPTSPKESPYTPTFKPDPFDGNTNRRKSNL
jgi:hypothetical protein